jgi:putative ABC transport system permease protein
VIGSLLRIPLALVVLFYQSLFLALGQIRTNKVRSLLTMVGIIIGVASVTAVIAALTGLKNNVLSEFETLGTNKMFISVDVPETGRFSHMNWRQLKFRPEQFAGWKEHCPDIKALSLLCYLGANVSYNDRSEQNVRVMGIEPDWHQIENRSVTIGRPFSYVDNEQARAVCLINDKMRTKLNLPVDCEGKAIMVGQRRYTVVGVVESHAESSMFGEGESGSEVFVPFNTAYFSPRIWVHAIASSASPEVSEEARAEMRFFLRQRRQLRLDDPDTFRIEVVQQFIDKFKQIATTMTLVAGGVVGISLIVGGVGIMNIMLVSVSERTREIGLRKAVGARPSAILLQFLVEAVMLCCMGGALGVLGGAGLTKLISNIPGAHLDKATIPGWAIAVSFGFAASVGLIFGMFPAIKAAQLDPIEALRHE